MNIIQRSTPFALAMDTTQVENMVHQDDGGTDYIRISPTDTTASFALPTDSRTSGIRIVAVAASKLVKVSIELDNRTVTTIGYVGGVASVQADLQYFWSVSTANSDGSYPKIKFERDGTWTGNQDLYLWWHK